MLRSVVNPGKLLWSGEHWVNYLREPGEESDSGMVSIYHTCCCPLGEGNVAFVDIPGIDGFTGILSDNRELVGFIVETIIRGKVTHFDKDLIIMDAEFNRDGDIRYAPIWIIQADRYRIVATWNDIQTPVIVEGPAPTFDKDTDFFTVLFFAKDASISLNEDEIPGEPYLRGIWRKSIGGLRSSCVFALAETMTKVPEK